MSIEKNIVLCGFMGSGKTTVGEILSRRLEADFIDMDKYIENREGMTIPEMFEKLGEPEFREREYIAARELSGMRGIVLATGGGALTFERNASVLRQTGVLLFLNVSFGECYRRIKDSDRPLLRSNTMEAFESLYRLRREIYRAIADFELNSDGPAEEVAGDAIKLLASL